VEYIIRQKVYDSGYWKQHCFGLSAERVVDKAAELRFVGGMYGQPQKPTEFLSLLLKMLQIQPDKEIIVEFIKNDDFKYLRLLGAFYLRLVGRAVDVYQYLEPLLNDYRRVRVRGAGGGFELSHVDSLIDDMLRRDYLFDIALPRLPARDMLEKVGQLEARVSVLEEEFEEQAAAEEAETAAQEAAAAAAAAAAAGGRGADDEDGERRDRERGREKWRLGRGEEGGRRGGRSRSRSRGRDRERGRDRRQRSRSRSRSRGRRSRSRSRDRDRGRDGRGSGRSYEDDEVRGRSGREGGGGGGGGRRERSRSRSRDRRRARSRSPGRGGGVKKARGDEGGGGGGDKAALSVEETNRLRISLGLAPLK
jgi:pre-mRNA-splicing factor 38A